MGGDEIEMMQVGNSFKNMEVKVRRWGEQGRRRVVKNDLNVR